MKTGLSLSHIGITVDDLDAALDWYSEVFGFQTVIPATASSLDTPDAPMMRAMFGPRFGSLRYAVVSTGSGVFLELFESTDPPTERAPQPAEFWRTGPWHIAVNCSDVEGLVATIERRGGRALTAITPLVAGAPFEICMCVDPFGVTVEVYSHPLEEILAAVAG